MKTAYFGTLRKGGRWWEVYKEGLKYIKTVKIDGFKMFDVGSYPAVIRGEGSIVAEVFDVEEATGRSIDRMEIGAGYSIGKVDIDGEECSIYLQEPEQVEGLKHIESGDYFSKEV
jgi:gamma-glutamylcyclotransferase (GGCT)/AIG2-like uncharacterized protein YtfP